MPIPLFVTLFSETMVLLEDGRLIPPALFSMLFPMIMLFEVVEPCSLAIPVLLSVTLFPEMRLPLEGDPRKTP